MSTDESIGKQVIFNFSSHLELLLLLIILPFANISLFKISDLPMLPTPSDPLENKLNCLRLFRVDEFHSSDQWLAIQKECAYLSNWGINTLANGLDGYVKTIVLEKDYLCRDHRNLFSNFYSKKFKHPNPICSRLHFFNKAINKVEELQILQDELQYNYMGFCIIRDVKERCLGRTIIDPHTIGKCFKNGFFYISTSFEVNICGAKYEVKGYPYMSQDTDATVCAHSALWGICRYLSQRYRVYREIYPYDLIKMTGHMGGRAFPYRGMTYEDFSSILTEIGCHPLIIRLKASLKSNRQSKVGLNDVYTYVESGFPVLAMVPRHVVTLIGHTVNKNKKVPQSVKIVDSSFFVKQFIIVDDNKFPYDILGQLASPKGKNGYSCYSIKMIHAIVCPLPEKAFLPAEMARKKALIHFAEITERFQKELKGHQLVTRLLLTTGSALKKEKLKDYIDNPYEKISYLITKVPLPHFVWLMELYTLSSYKKGNCIGEVVLDSTAGKKEKGTIYWRFKNLLSFEDKESIFLNNPKFFSQYTHNLGED